MTKLAWTLPRVYITQLNWLISTLCENNLQLTDLNSTSKTSQGVQLQCILYLQGDSSIVDIFLQVNYIKLHQLSTGLWSSNKNISIYKTKKLYSSIFLHPQTHNPYTVTKSLHIIKLPLLSKHYHHLCQKVTFTPKSNP